MSTRFFLFKKKTAYEVRISDWSSDVCSSDLGCATIADTSMTKLFVTETAKDIVLACQQVMGAYGYADGFGMERYVRDVLALPIYGGSSAIQRNNIANSLGLPRA